MYTTSNTGSTPRRTSYASVAAGTSASQLGQPVPTRQGAFSHLMNPAPTYSHHTQFDHLSRMSRPPSDYERARGIDIPETWGRVGGAPSYSSHTHYRYGKPWPGLTVPEPFGFFTPTYLRGSKYMEHLEAAHKSKIAAQRDAHSAHSSHAGPLSTSSSSVSLHKLAPSHRGMTYEIIERMPPSDDDGVPPLPSKWGEVDKLGGLEIAADGMDVKYVGSTKLHEHEAVAARADQPMPPECGLYYFEVTINSKGKEGSVILFRSGRHC